MVGPGGPVDVAVIGGGIVGAACSYYLAQAGLHVTLIEQEFPAARTSGACEGNILLWDKEVSRELPLAARSLALWKELVRALDVDFEYHRKGSIMVAENAAGLAALQRKLADLAAVGVAGTFLGERELHAEEPALAPDLPGGALFPDDGQVDPRYATNALVEGARRLGLQVQAGTVVRRLILGQGRIEAVETSTGRIPAKAVVLAAGVWSREIAAAAGVDLPVHPRKGQIVVVGRAPTVVHRKLMEAGYVATVESSAAALQVAMVAESTRAGTLLLGSSRELVGFDRQVSPATVAAIAERALRFLPGLSSARCIRTYAGLRPFSPDHLPVIGPVTAVDGLYVATGHEGSGICLAPATGRLIAQWITGQALDFPAAWFGPDRFQGGQGTHNATQAVVHGG